LQRRCIDAAVMIIAESGLASLSLREVARRTGVTHQAPYRHFPTRVDLLVAIALEGYALLSEQQAGPLPDPADMHRDEVMASTQEMAVSRSSLRKAVRRLEQSGLLMIVPNRGVFVLDSAALAPYRDVETTPGPVASS